MQSRNQDNKNIELSIILISFNTAQITANCIESIYNSKDIKKIALEVIVLDNASSDHSIQTIKSLQKKYSSLKLIESKENTGFSKGNNLAAKQAKGEYILFLNSDTLVLENAVYKLLTFYKTNQQKAQFIGAKLFNKNMTSQPSAGPFYSLSVVFGALFLKGDYWGLTRSSPDRTTKIDWVSGACIMTKKQYFDEVGGFDEGIFMYMEEIDLLYRARQKNYNTYFYPDAQFIHLGSASSNGKTFPILQVYNGFLYFYNKHHKGMALNILKGMLQLKALVSLAIGRITGKEYLIKTYEKAYHIASMA
ncbi:MAG TPA: glycosyltransferase family 2 protein [Candidatus Woesebacteria bacterium]|nr:glycosyltransferase family 2 protein [Candidatus Woesebacteria bacterium]